MAEKKNYEIKITKDGPYVVSGNLPLKHEIIVTDEDGEPIMWAEGEKCPDKETYSLCRCGHSETKPYCSGKHIEIGFDGTETASREKYIENADKTEGTDLDLTDNRKFCASARFCHRKGGTWSLTENSDEPDSKKTAIQQACDCPSGRLVAWDKKTGEPIEPKLEPSISLVEDPDRNVNGPIWAKGGAPVESAEGEEYEIRNRVTLCRCGNSKNKPFCDGSHLHSS